MATNTAVGVLISADGRKIPLSSELAEGTEGDLKTDSAYSVSSQQVGDYMPGAVITHGLVSTDNGCAYAFVLRQGLVAAIIPISIKGVGGIIPALCKPITLIAGDKLRVMNNQASDREATLMVYTQSGIERIFVVTPSTGATNELVDLQTGNSIGDTLQNQLIVKSAFTSVDGSKIESQGAYVVDSINNVVGSVANNSPIQSQTFMTSCAIPVGLNFKAQFLTNA